MEKNFKNILFSIVTVSMLSFGFAGCGDEDASDTPNTTTSDTSGTTAPNSTDKTVLDSVTQLEWQDLPQDETPKFNQIDAMAYCSNLSYAGNEDWILPNINVLFSINRNDFQYTDYQLLSSSSIDATYKYANMSLDEIIIESSTLDGRILPLALSGEYAVNLDIDSLISVKCVRGIKFFSSSDYGLWLYDDNSELLTIDKDTYFIDFETIDINHIKITSYGIDWNRGYKTTRDLIRASIPDEAYYGRWAYVDNAELLNIDKDTYFIDIEIIDINHIKVTNFSMTNGKVTGTIVRHLIRAGIPDVKLKGEIASIITDTTSKSKARAVSRIGNMNIILASVSGGKSKEVEVVITDDSSLLGKVIDDKLYVQDPVKTGGRVVIPEGSELSVSTGDTDVTVSDGDNNATFRVSVIGEETDMGILTVTDKPYNFKSYIEHENDWRYFGYNNGEGAISYSKTLKICNIGTENISGVSFDITLDSNATDIKRTFSTNYDGSAVPFESGECKSYDTDFSFTRPIEDKDVKINITINDNFNALTWNDYASLKVSQYPHHNLYFNSNTKKLNGFLTTPGRNLVNVEFSNSSDNNFLRVPLVQTDQYDVIISTPNITDEDVYMITSGLVPDTTKMDSFTDVLANEPDNKEEDATEIALFKGESVAYLAQGDIDFYTIVDKPLVTHKVTHAYVDYNISISMNTNMNSSTISTDTITVRDSSGKNVAGVVTYDTSSKTIIFDPNTNFSTGTYTVLVDKSLKSATNYALVNDVTWNFTISDYLSAMTVVDEVKSYYYSEYYPEADLYINSWITDDNYIYRKHGNQLVAFDIRDPLNIEQIGTYTRIGGDAHSFGKGLKKIDDIIYADDAYRGFDILNASDINSISRVSSTDLSDSISELTYDSDVSNNYAYIIGNGTKSFVILDVSNISEPVIVADSSTIGGSIIRVDGNYAYIGDYRTLRVIDISNKTNIVEVASEKFDGEISDIKIVDEYIYLAMNEGLTILNITNPTSPLVKSTLVTNTSYYYSTQVAISGNYAFLASGESGLNVIDIRDKTSPKIVDTFSDEGEIQKVLVSGNFAYIFNATSKSIKAINIQMYK